MAEEPASSGIENAGRLLFDLLTTRPAYKRRWQARTKRLRSPAISYAAVARVVTEHLWEQAIYPDTDQKLARSLRGRIERALQGKALTFDTLEWITEAFEFDEPDRHNVWNAFSGGGVEELEDGGIKNTLINAKPPIITPQRHRTTALFSRYVVDGSQMLKQVDTSHVMVAQEDGVDSYAHNPRDTLLDMRAVAGGKVVAFHESAPGFIGVEFKLSQPLRKGQSTSLQYIATYNPTSQPCTQVRRAARGRTDNVDIRVCFEGTPPRHAWWCVWDDHIDGNALRRLSVDVVDGQLHRFVPYIEQTVVGFEWEW